ncbi:hypothetical protein [Erwinia mallotivora]|uniref:hypothetical protein n=1 Tax=Erwinia mallotivora TaxID=69222 RepID=UPI0021BF4259|nr:hypothetical protein [Erwinia mallotivora]
MKRISIIAVIVMMISGCQQQIKEFNDDLTNIGSYPAASNSGQKFGWESLPMVTEDEVCSAFRQDKKSARAKYIGRDLIQNGIVQCVIEKPYAWNVGNVISLPRKKAVEEHARLVIEHGVYVSQKGKILTIENYSNLPNGSDCNISIDLSSFNGSMN